MPTRDYTHLTPPELIELLRRRDAQAHFGLVWERDEIEYDRKLNDDFVGLVMDSEKSFGSPPYGHLIIEGDNFDALRHLLMTHAGRINVIVADPPYNTGNTSRRQGWVYNDRFFDPASRFRHSTWLEFMYPRLQLANDLLSDEGVMFVHIDDTELYNLKLLMDRVFGPQNFIGNIVWKNVTDNNPSRVTVEHEYILVYAKNKAANPAVWKSANFDAKEALLAKETELLAEYMDAIERQSVYTHWHRENKAFLGPLADYKFIDDSGIYCGSRSVHNPGTEGYRYDVPFKGDTSRPCKMPLMGYRFPWDTMKRLLEEDRILFGSTPEKLIELKLYVKDYKSKLPSVIDLDGRKGPNELKAIFGGTAPFNNPKPSELITELLTYVSKPDDTVLDFFAGSGTTGHAVLELNRLDSGQRKFILVSSTEAVEDGTEAEQRRNVCRDVCAERIQRVMVGYTAADGTAQGGYGGGFAYMKARVIPRHRLELELDDQTIWSCICLLEELPLTAIAQGEDLGWQVRADGTAIAYPCGTRDRNIAAFVTRAEGHDGPIRCFAWAPAKFEAAVPRAAVLPLPDTLLRNFRKSVEACQTRAQKLIEEE